MTTLAVFTLHKQTTITKSHECCWARWAAFENSRNQKELQEALNARMWANHLSHLCFGPEPAQWSYHSVCQLIKCLSDQTNVTGFFIISHSVYFYIIKGNIQWVYKCRFPSPPPSLFLINKLCFQGQVFCNRLPNHSTRYIYMDRPGGEGHSSVGNTRR